MTEVTLDIHEAVLALMLVLQLEQVPCYFEQEAGRRSATKSLTRDEARRIAVNAAD